MKMKLRTYQLILCLSLLTAQFWSCTKQETPIVEAPDPQEELLTVDDKTYTVAEVLTAFQEEVGFQDILRSVALENMDDSASPAKIEKISVDKLIEKSGRTFAYEKYYAQKARESGLTELDDFKTYTDDIVKSELYEKMIIDDVLQKIHFSDEQIQQYYELIKDRFKSAKTDLISLCGIVVQTNGKSAEDAWAKIQEAQEKIKQGEEFEQVAKTYSESPIEIRGTIQEFRIDDFVNVEIPRKLLELKDGEISDVIPSGDKLFLYKRYSYTPPQYTPLDEVKQIVLEYYTIEVRDRESALLFLDLKEKHQPSVFPEWLADPQPEQMDANVISLPGVYEMKLRDFLDAAKKQQINTYKDQVEYLQLLTQKSVMAAEALARGWDESTVQPIVDYYKNKWLTKEYFLSLIQDQLPPENEIQASYTQNINHEKIQIPSRYDLYTLFFPANFSLEQTPLEREQNFLAAQQKAQKAYQEFQEGTPFEELVKTYSHDEYHLKSGGRLGLLSLGELDPVRSSNLSRLDLKEGFISEPMQIFHNITSRYGYEIYFIKKIDPAHPMPYPEAREFLLNAAKDTLYRREQQRLFQEWEKAHTVRFHSLTLELVKNYLIQIAQRPDTRQVDIYRYTEPITDTNPERKGPPTQ
jgi:parvulin-like peptidyl-prolyl isomerase